MLIYFSELNSHCGVNDVEGCAEKLASVEQDKSHYGSKDSHHSPSQSSSLQSIRKVLHGTIAVRYQTPVMTWDRHR